MINEAYLSGGSAGAAFKNKFVELYNPSDSDVDLGGWSLQYRSATSTSAPTAANTVALTGSIPAGGTYLVAGGTNSASSTAPELPTPDVSASGLGPSGTTGTLILASTTERLALPAGDPSAADGVIDALGYGTSNTFEGSAPATAPSSNTDVRSMNRTGGVDTNDNRADFTLSADITPTNSKGEGPVPPEPEPEPEPSDLIAISDIQGTGSVSPIDGKAATTRGVVTATYPTGGFNGYYIQTAGTGGAIDPSTHTASDAIFVYSPSTVASVAVGDYVEVTGWVGEHYGLTQLSVMSAAGLSVIDEQVSAPKPAEIAYPATEEERERFEGMLIAPQGDYTVTNTYDSNQFGTIGLAASDKPFLTPTVAGLPGTPAHQAELDRVAREGVQLDDGASTNYVQNNAAKNTPLPYLSVDEPVRTGAAVTFTSPVILDFRYDNWSFQPVGHLTGDSPAGLQPVSFENTREQAPAEVGGAVKIGTFNVLNYFTTTGDAVPGCTYYTDRAGTPITVNTGCSARGAATGESLERQQAKIVAAINGLGADVVSLEEIENSSAFGENRDVALNGLVAALNADAGAGTWASVASPAGLPANEDVIRTAFIYKPSAIETVGASRILTDSPAFGNAREPNAQAFKEKGSSDDTAFVVVANHFKSKGGTGTGDNRDQGQGSFNDDRTRQAEALVAFADTVAEDIGTEDVFLVGDFNAYAAENPVGTILGAGYVDIGARTGKHTYAFGGAVGSLDHVFASNSAAAKVTGQDIWNINSPESIALEYSRYNYNATNFYDESAFRSSDHDPILLGFDPAGGGTADTILNILNINDFHGRIDNNTVNFAGTVEQLRLQHPDSTLFLSAGDNIGASLFASSSQNDQPTIDVLNAMGLAGSAVGNHEFDQGFDDLVNRVVDGGNNATFDYLGANVYAKGSTDPVLPEYAMYEVGGKKVAVIGVVTEETPTLVSPAGIADLEFGNPVEAVNRVAAQLTDGDPANGEADIIIAEYHEGAGSSQPDGGTIEDELKDADSAFSKIVTETTPAVDAIFTGHTHKQYAWDAPVPGEAGKTRPILQTGSYGEHIGQITLTVDAETGDVSTYTAKNIARTKTPAAELIAQFPVAAQVDTIVKAALAEAEVIGGRVIGSQTADITRAISGANEDDRGSESSLGNFVANSLRDSLSGADRGSVEIGMVNPGGLRDNLIKSEDGSITYAQANAVLPFLNNLWTTNLTGEQFIKVLNQQWQRDAAGAVPSRDYLQLGLSDNVSYTFDPSKPEGKRITSVTIDGKPIDLKRSYRIGSFSFLLQGGDNFRELDNGKGTRDTGLVDRDAWIDYLTENSPVSPQYDRRSVQVSGLPTGTVDAGASFDLGLAKLDLTSRGGTTTTEVTATIGDETVGTAPVSDDAAALTVQLPAGLSGEQTLRITANGSGTVVTIPLTIESGDGKPSGAPVAAGEDSLTDALKGLVSTVDSAAPGETITVTLDAERAGDWVSAWLYSTPVSLTPEWQRVASDGTITVTIPEDAEEGEHRLAVQDADNGVIGWAPLRIVADSTGGTDGTGGSDGSDGSDGSGDSDGAGSDGAGSDGAGSDGAGSDGSGVGSDGNGSGTGSHGSGIGGLPVTGQEGAALAALAMILLGVGASVLITQRRKRSA